MGKSINITTPVGRMVGGALYDPSTTDYENKPLTMKDKVTPRVEYSVGIAIPKTPGVQHWANEVWGGPIWALANEAWRNGETQRPDFAWKITDGDSTIPNKRGRKPCDREGYPGHWVLYFSGGYAPKIYNADGSQLLLEKDAIKPGYYIQVFGSVTDNAPSASPGMYLNLTYVALTAYGQEITIGPDVSAAGFGANVQLPPGASSTPPASFNPAPPPVTPPPQVQQYAPPQNTVVTPPPQVAATIPVVPNTAILTPPPQVNTIPNVPVGRQMTALAQGTYQDYINKGWTDDLLIANGLMTA